MTGAQLDVYLWPVRVAVILLFAWLGWLLILEIAGWVARQRRGRKGGK